jgi:hypothetical protein
VSTVNVSTSLFFAFVSLVRIFQESVNFFLVTFWEDILPFFSLTS